MGSNSSNLPKEAAIVSVLVANMYYLPTKCEEAAQFSITQSALLKESKRHEVRAHALHYSVITTDMPPKGLHWNNIAIE